ncbi:MAG: AAA family ATPase [Methylocystaceae bacterium]
MNDQIISVLIVDDAPSVREAIRLLLQRERDIRVVGECRDGIEAVQQCCSINPDVVLMDVHMPAMDGIAATAQICEQCPGTSVVIISVQQDLNIVRQAMLAGAKDYIIKPFSNKELTETVRKVVLISKRKETIRGLLGDVPVEKRRGQVISIFGAKGGTGKTALAVNLSLALHRSGYKTALIDMDLQFGNVRVAIDVQPKRTLTELMQEEGEFTPELVASYLENSKGIAVMCGPEQPEYAELISVDGISRTIKALQQIFDYIVIDTGRRLDDQTLTIMEMSQPVLMVTTPDLASLRNARKYIDVMQNLGLTHRVQLVINNPQPYRYLDNMEIERTLKKKALGELPYDAKSLSSSLDRGNPVVGKSITGSFGRAVISLTERLIRLETTEKTASSI